MKIVSSSGLRWYNWIEYFVLAILMSIGTGGMIRIYVSLDWDDVLNVCQKAFLILKEEMNG